MKFCSKEGCKNWFRPHRWGTVEAHNKGWFHQRNGQSWCPDHTPDWVAEWRAKKNQESK